MSARSGQGVIGGKSIFVVASIGIRAGAEKHADDVREESESREFISGTCRGVKKFSVRCLER